MELIYTVICTAYIIYFGDLLGRCLHLGAEWIECFLDFLLLCSGRQRVSQTYVVLYVGEGLKFYCVLFFLHFGCLLLVFELVLRCC